MRSFVIGTRDDVAGFALAGVQGAVCATREEVESALATLGAQASSPANNAGGTPALPEETIVIVSASLPALLPKGITQMVVVLPEG
jgi:hypothetical protein